MSDHVTLTEENSYLTAAALRSLARYRDDVDRATELADVISKGADTFGRMTLKSDDLTPRDVGLLMQALGFCRARERLADREHLARRHEEIAETIKTLA